MVRRTRRWRAPKDAYGIVELFVEETKKIARTSALLMAYHASTGILLRANRSAFARERMEVESERCRSMLSQTGRDDLMAAMEVAATRARVVYTGDWWTAEPCNGAPERMGPGDEYFSWMTVRRVIERMSDPVADRMG
jgi:hypothetical protein